MGGDVGVFYTDDAGAHWYNAGHPLGLPNVPVFQLQVPGPTIGMLIATTYGRGIYSARLQPAVKIASLTINPSSVKGGTSASGTITMKGAAPPGGIHAYLTSSVASAQVPAVVIIDSGKTSVTFTIATTSVTLDVKGTITAMCAGTSAQPEACFRDGRQAREGAARLFLGARPGQKTKPRSASAMRPVFTLVLLPRA